LERLLERVHREAGAVLGEICIALTLHRVTGGRGALRRWAAVLRAMADLLDEAGR
jgi:hypothetical protein